jgi:hypothetical protein
VYYDIDTYGGQAAALRIASSTAAATRWRSRVRPTTNPGTRIVTPVFNNMVAWKR